MPDQVDFKTLVGLRILDAVDPGLSANNDASVIKFRIGGIVYAATENPDDGYRSSMESLLIEPTTVMKNVFPPILVMVRMSVGDGINNDDVLEFVDILTDLVVLEIGTSNTGDYYPSFVGSWHPENMCLNKNKPKDEIRFSGNTP